jgi:hypothetical protein
MFAVSLLLALPSGADEAAEGNPHFPALRADPLALSGASRRKQTPSRKNEIFGTLSSNSSNQENDPSANPAPTLRRVLAKLPLDAREYFMARLLPSDLGEP